jgi:hypothetical protein
LLLLSTHTFSLSFLHFRLPPLNKYLTNTFFVFIYSTVRYVNVSAQRKNGRLMNDMSDYLEANLESKNDILQQGSLGSPESLSPVNKRNSNPYEVSDEY